MFYKIKVFTRHEIFNKKLNKIINYLSENLKKHKNYNHCTNAKFLTKMKCNNGIDRNNKKENRDKKLNFLISVKRPKNLISVF